MSDETYMMGASPMAPPAPAPASAPTQPALTQPAPANAGSGTARRTVLAGVGVVAAGALGYAVGFGGQLTRPEQAAAQDSAAQEKAQTDAALVAVADVPAGGGTVVKDAKVVVTKDESGQVKAFSAICTHQGCTVASVSGGTINCPCHGSRFDAATGRPVAGPAKSPLPTVAVAVRDGSVVRA